MGKTNRRVNGRAITNKDRREIDRETMIRRRRRRIFRGPPHAQGFHRFTFIYVHGCLTHSFVKTEIDSQISPGTRCTAKCKSHCQPVSRALRILHRIIRPPCVLLRRRYVGSARSVTYRPFQHFPYVLHVILNCSILVWSHANGGFSQVASCSKGWCDLFQLLYSLRRECVCRSKALAHNLVSDRPTTNQHHRTHLPFRTHHSIAAFLHCQRQRFFVQRVTLCTLVLLLSSCFGSTLHSTLL